MGRLDQRRRGPQRRDAEQDSETIDYFLERIPKPSGFHFLDPARLWPSVRDTVLEQWIAEAPGTRPPWWWHCDAPRWADAPNPHDRGRLPEPRRRLGGIGTPMYEALCYVPTFSRGIPDMWVSEWESRYYNDLAKDVHGNPIGTEFKTGNFAGVAIDPSNPPTYESEASYLHRHGLLGGAELAAVKRLGLLTETVYIAAPDEPTTTPATAN